MSQGVERVQRACAATLPTVHRSERVCACVHSLAKTEGMARGVKGEMNIKVNLLKRAEIVSGVFKILYKVKKNEEEWVQDVESNINKKAGGKQRKKRIVIRERNMKCSKPQAVGKSVCRRVRVHAHMRVCVKCVWGVLEPQWGFLPEFIPLERGKEREEESERREEGECVSYTNYLDFGPARFACS